MLPTSRLQAEAELLKLHFEDMLVRWGSNSPVRTSLHASAVLVPQSEWCVREHVLMDLFPEQAQKEKLQPWDWKRQDTFLHGWELHRKWQHLFKNYGRVAHTLTEDGLEPELDLTHYDEARNIYFSPDAILEFAGQRYVVEIKGIKQESYQELTDSLETAIEVNETVAKARIQANLYMHLLGLKKAILLIENKNNQEFKVWVIEYDATLSVNYVQRIYDVQGAIINIRRTRGLEIIPPRICTSAGDGRARKCPMRACCFSREMEPGE